MENDLLFLCTPSSVAKTSTRHGTSTNSSATLAEAKKEAQAKGDHASAEARRQKRMGYWTKNKGQTREMKPWERKIAERAEAKRRRRAEAKAKADAKAEAEAVSVPEPLTVENVTAAACVSGLATNSPSRTLNKFSKARKADNLFRQLSLEATDKKAKADAVCFATLCVLVRASYVKPHKSQGANKYCSHM